MKYKISNEAQSGIENIWLYTFKPSAAVVIPTNRKNLKMHSHKPDFILRNYE